MTPNNNYGYCTIWFAISKEMLGETNEEAQ